MTHGAPDWQETAVGPGGEPLGGLPYYTGTVGVGITDTSADGITLTEDGASSIELVSAAGVTLSSQTGIFIADGGTGNIDIGTTDGDVTISASGATGFVQLRGAAGTLGIFLGGIGDALAFYGTVPITKPVVNGSRGGNGALTVLLSQLANLGLITDSTTP
jgi:hypothetical protein